MNQISPYTDGFDFTFDQICPKKVFPVENGKIALVHASMIVTCYVKLFHRGPTETISNYK